MTKLKLGPLPDDKPVKVTVELPAQLHCDLAAYAEVLARETGQPAPSIRQAHRAHAGAVHRDRSRVCGGSSNDSRKFVPASFAPSSHMCRVTKPKYYASFIRDMMSDGVDIVTQHEDDPAVPNTADLQLYLDNVAALRDREKRHTREGDAIAAERRRLPMVEVDAATPLVGERGAVTLLDAFEGRRMLIAYYFMWHAGRPAADQCEGCTLFTSQVRDLTVLHSRDVTYATFVQGPYAESRRYRDFMGWTMPWYSVEGSLDTLLEGRRAGMMHLVSYLRVGDRVFETYWTTRRGVEVMDNNLALLALTPYGRQEPWEDSPPGWPQAWGEGKARMRVDGRPIGQWARLNAGFSDDIGSRTDHA